MLLNADQDAIRGEAPVFAQERRWLHVVREPKEHRFPKDAY